MKFKVGDKVKILKTTSYYFKVGDIVTVNRVNTPVENCYECISTHLRVFLLEDEIELENTPAKTQQALRYNSNKIEFDDMPLLGIVEVAKVAAYGATKYAKNNWRKSAQTTQYLNCAMRHIMKYMYGEEFDSESKGMHLGHAAWNLLALIEKIKMGKDIDDRFIYDSDTNLDEVFQLNDAQKVAIEKMGKNDI